MYILTNLILDFFVSMGMVVGGSLLGGLATAITHTRPPMTTMVTLAEQLKIWALVSTLGGTMDTLRVIESSVLGLKLKPILLQFTYLTAAFIGCQIGYVLIRWLAGSEFL